MSRKSVFTVGYVCLLSCFMGQSCWSSSSEEEECLSFQEYQRQYLSFDLFSSSELQENTKLKNDTSVLTTDDLGRMSPLLFQDKSGRIHNLADKSGN